MHFVLLILFMHVAIAKVGHNKCFRNNSKKVSNPVRSITSQSPR